MHTHSPVSTLLHSHLSDQNVFTFTLLSNWKQMWRDLRRSKGHVCVTAINLAFTIASYGPVEWVIVTEQFQAPASSHTSLEQNTHPRWFWRKIWANLGSVKKWHVSLPDCWLKEVVRWRRRGWRKMKGRMLHRREDKKRVELEICMVLK